MSDMENDSEKVLELRRRHVQELQQCKQELYFWFQEELRKRNEEKESIMTELQSLKAKHRQQIGENIQALNDQFKQDKIKLQEEHKKAIQVAVEGLHKRCTTLEQTLEKRKSETARFRECLLLLGGQATDSELESRSLQDAANESLREFEEFLQQTILDENETASQEKKVLEEGKEILRKQHLLYKKAMLSYKEGEKEVFRLQNCLHSSETTISALQKQIDAAQELLRQSKEKQETSQSLAELKSQGKLELSEMKLNEVMQSRNSLSDELQCAKEQLLELQGRFMKEVAAKECLEEMSRRRESNKEEFQKLVVNKDQQIYDATLRMQHVESELSWSKSEVSQLKLENASKDELIRNLQQRLQKVESKERQKITTLQSQVFDLSSGLKVKQRECESLRRRVEHVGAFIERMGIGGVFSTNFPPIQQLKLSGPAGPRVLQAHNSKLTSTNRSKQGFSRKQQRPTRQSSLKASK